MTFLFYFACRNNNCFATQSLYVEIIIGILKLTPCDIDLLSRVPSLLHFAQMALPLLSECNHNILFKATFLAKISELLLLIASNSRGWGVIEFPSYGNLIMQCCNHVEVEIRQCGIEMIQSLPIEHTKNMEDIIFNMFCSESNEDILMKVNFEILHIQRDKFFFLHW